MTTSQMLLASPNVTSENLVIDNYTYGGAINSAHITLKDTNISASCIETHTGNIFIRGGTHYMLVATAYADNPANNIRIEGNVHTRKVDINADGRIALAGSWKLQNATFSGSLAANIDALNNEEIFKGEYRGHLREYLEYTLKCNEVTHDVFWDSLKVTMTLLDGAYNVKQFCAIPDVHIKESCRCGFYYPLLLLGDDVALSYYMRMTPHLSDLLPVTVEAVSKDITEQVLNKTLVDNYHSRNRQATAYQSDLKNKLQTYGINAPTMFFNQSNL